MERKCFRCEILPEVAQTERKLYFVFAVDTLKLKTKLVLESLNVAFEDRGDRLEARVENFKNFLISLRNVGQFSQPELEDIALMALGVEESFNLSNFRRLKPLAVWFSLLEFEEYLEILELGRLTVHFQPVVDVKSLCVVGQECLVRGVRRDGSLLPPSVLFEAAERTDTLFYLDRACRETAIKTAAVKNLRGCKVFINFVPSSVYDPIFCLESTVKWSKTLEFEPENLVFEVVESQKVKDVQHLKKILDYYRERGFMVALDDVGTGYSSLEMLIKLKPDVVKVDKEIVRDVHGDEMKRKVFEALVSMCKDAGIKVLAEGVETKEEFHFVKDRVDYAQGYFFSKPNPEPIVELKLTQL